MKHIGLLGLLLASSACSTLGSNVSGDFACDAPEGLCAPAAAIDARAIAQIAGPSSQPSGGALHALPVPLQGRVLATGLGNGTPPARSSDKTIKVVFPAHIDEAGIYHEESSAHVVVERGAWVEALAGRAVAGTAAAPMSPQPQSTRSAAFQPGQPIVQSGVAAAASSSLPASAAILAPPPGSAGAALVVRAPAVPSPASGATLPAPAASAAVPDAPARAVANEPVARAPALAAPSVIQRTPVPASSARKANLRLLAETETSPVAAPAPSRSPLPQTLAEAAAGAEAPDVVRLDTGGASGTMAAPAVSPQKLPTPEAIAAARARAAERQARGQR